MLIRKEILKSSRISIPDLFFFVVVGGAILAVTTTAERWTMGFQRDVPIDLSTGSLLTYSLLSLTRGIIAYLISLTLALVCGYLAAKSRFWERIILPILDIGQSLPVLGFLPGLVLGLVAIFPNSNIGLELACILMIVTSQMWNMAFSFYSSLKAIPPEFIEVAKVSRINPLVRFVKVELPFAATPLAWNSLVSIAGGWFFLTVCESFQLKGQSFRLPGLGSFMAEALDQGKTSAVLMGITAMMCVIILLDFIIWRPIISWSQKFRPDDLPLGDIEVPFVSLMFRQSRIVEEVSKYFRALKQKARPYYLKIEEKFPLQSKELDSLSESKGSDKKSIFKLFKSQFRTGIAITILIALAIWIFGQLYLLVKELELKDWILITKSALLTLSRIGACLILATLWTLPVGVLIGLSPRLTRLLQPVIQVFASFPSPMIYPLVFIAFKSIGIGLGVSSIFLLMVGVQWYILFNVLAGSVQIAQQHTDSFKLMGLGWKEHWKKLYLPSIFPYLVTGWITAAGGAWNASIVTEYLDYGGHTYSTDGLGALVTRATADGNFQLLSASLMVMVGLVILLNRSVWKFLFRYAETRFSMES
ncbi:MAG: ABC transporter permease subunit [Bdellovibrionota bacterium]